MASQRKYKVVYIRIYVYMRICRYLCMCVQVFVQVCTENEEYSLLCFLIFTHLFVVIKKDWVWKKTPWIDYYIRGFFKCK